MISELTQSGQTVEPEITIKNYFDTMMGGDSISNFFRKPPGQPIVFLGESDHPLWEVFRDAVSQAEKGKGEERHGQGKDFYKQPWVELAKTHGIGFLSGQSQKKIMEAMSAYGKEGCTDGWWEKELLGALNYLAMAILYHRHIK